MNGFNMASSRNVFRTLYLFKRLNSFSLVPSYASFSTIYKCSASYIHPNANLQVFQNDKLLRRFRHRKRGRNMEEESSDEDSDDDSDSDEEVTFNLKHGENFREKQVNIKDLRLDAVLKAALRVSRNKVDTAFYGGKIKVIGEPKFKKSDNVYIDFVVHINRQVLSPEEDSGVTRVEIVDIKKYQESRKVFPMHLRIYPQYTGKEGKLKNS